MFRIWTLLQEPQMIKLKSNFLVKSSFEIRWINRKWTLKSCLNFSYNSDQLGHNAVEAIKNICCTNGKGDHGNQMVEEISLEVHETRQSCKVRLKPRIPRPCSKSERQIQWVVLGIPQYNMVCYFHELGKKDIPSCRFVAHFTKILQNF